MEMETTILKNLITDSEFYGKVYPYIEKHHFQSVETSEIFGSLQQYVLKYDTQPNMMELGLFIKNNNTTAENLKTMVIDGYKRIMSDPSVQNKEFLITETEKYIQKIELTNAIIKGAEIIEQDEPFETVVGLVEQAISMNFDADIGLDYKSSVDDRFSYYTEKILG
ncbi:MAG: hypothetical protein KAI79_14045, partial [Bacteroidales bacterium]|nr:hypothetical protein [Bacteroidales bacterium]